MPEGLLLVYWDKPGYGADAVHGAAGPKLLQLGSCFTAWQHNGGHCFATAALPVILLLPNA